MRKVLLWMLAIAAVLIVANIATIHFFESPEEVSIAVDTVKTLVTDTIG